MRNRSFLPKLELMEYRVTPTQIAPVPVALDTVSSPIPALTNDMDFTGKTGVANPPIWVTPLPTPTPAPSPPAPTPVYPIPPCPIVIWTT